MALKPWLPVNVPSTVFGHVWALSESMVWTKQLGCLKLGWLRLYHANIPYYTYIHISYLYIYIDIDIDIDTYVYIYIRIYIYV